MANVAILGYGTVGSGVFEVLSRNRAEISGRAGEQVSVARVLDLRDFPGDPVQNVITHDFNDILNDGSITAAAEAMGGVEPAFSYVSALLSKGVSVATSNKELVAARGARLTDIARLNGCRFMFEASVCGGMPIISLISDSLCSDVITGIAGILNGTTNFMLCKMGKEGVSFSAALAEAQRLGYAERSPEADIEGWDARRKLSILASLMCGRHIDDGDIPTEGVARVTDIDFLYAERINMTIKLLATCELTEGGAACLVAPCLVPAGGMFASAGGIYNAVKISGNCGGDVFLYGKGAGKVPTGAAIVSDLIEAVKYPSKKPARALCEARGTATAFGGSAMPRFVRLSAADTLKTSQSVKAEFSENDPHIFVMSQAKGEIGVLIHDITAERLEGGLKNVTAGSAAGVISSIRVYGE